MTWHAKILIFWIFVRELSCHGLVFDKLCRHQFISLDRDSDRSVFISNTIPHSLLQTPDKKPAGPKSHQIAREKTLCGRKTALWRSEREWEELGWRGGVVKKFFMKSCDEKVLYGTSSFLKRLPKMMPSGNCRRGPMVPSHYVTLYYFIDHRNMDIEIISVCPTNF